MQDFYLKKNTAIAEATNSCLFFEIFYSEKRTAIAEATNSYCLFEFYALKK
jgi:hypothetical protein